MIDPTKTETQSLRIIHNVAAAHIFADAISDGRAGRAPTSALPRRNGSAISWWTIALFLLGSTMLLISVNDAYWK